MNLIFSGQAEQDLEEIADYIAQDNPRRVLPILLNIYNDTPIILSIKSIE